MAAENGSFSKLMCSGSSDENVQMFFLLIENVAAPVFNDMQRSFKILGYVNGDAFQFLHKRFPEKRSVSEEEKMYVVVKKRF